MTEQPSKSVSNGSKAIIFVSLLVDTMGLAIIIPVLPTLIKTLTGEDLSHASEYGGLMMMSFAAMQFLCAPLMGELSDRFGRKPILLLALTGLGLDYVAHAFAPTIGLLFLSRIFAGVFGASHTVAMAYMADISTPETKAKNFGLVGAAFGVGFFLGPFIGGYCAQWGYQVPFLVAAALSLLNVIVAIFVLPESLPKDRRRKIDWKKTLPFVSLAHLGKYKSLLLFIVSFTLTFLAGKVLESTWTFFTMEAYQWDEAQVGVSLGVVGLMVGIVQAGLVGWALKKFGNKKVIIFGYIIWTIGITSFAMATTETLLYVVLVPYTLGAVATPAIQGLMSNAVPEDEQGNLQGALASLISLTAIAGPPLFTGVFHHYTDKANDIYFPGAAFVVAGVIMLIAAILAFIALGKMKDILSHEDAIDRGEEE